MNDVINEMKQTIESLIRKYSNGTISLREQTELSEILSDAKNKDVEEVLIQHWQEELNSAKNADHQLKPILDRVHHLIRLNESRKTTPMGFGQIFQRTAAILILPLLLSFAAYYYFQLNQTLANVSFAQIECPMGVRTKFQLPDGTTGFLNSGSRLKYLVQFSEKREVELTGEAFFDVVHNTDMPFHVHTSNLDIKVLGTTFNVIANEDETTEEIVLQTGKVDVLSRSGKQLASLKPNEQLTLDIEKRTLDRHVVDAPQYSSWKEGKLVFRNENMQQVARRLSRWYNAEVVVEGQLLNDYTFHATFQDEPLDEVLKLLSITTPLRFSEEKRASDASGFFVKRKIILGINQSKLNQFK
ncbi:MAG: DUF4974 domain-containing protein [Prolixibacteraceae bacterium]|nr:DUF4974 domain-containing protein [Prolixibacteraceae bacterium]